TLLTRAFANLAEMLRLAGHLLTEDGEFLAMKGNYPKDELGQVISPFKVLEVCKLVVPGLDEQRHLVRITRA
ncbi:MAG: class I SAM-dependent methyltransferase, partial [Gammaproteobacteria bacterium]|nr:class I SAM-dependent methyltransferase [Gammaproteobacteria bacterium]